MDTKTRSDLGNAEIAELNGKPFVRTNSGKALAWQRWGMLQD